MSDESDSDGSWSDSEDDHSADSSSSGIDEELSSVSNRSEKDFEDITKIGKGRFGTVFKAKYTTDGGYYAIKRVPITSRDYDKEQALREVQLQTRLSHDNVVRYHHAWLGEKMFQKKQVDAFGDETNVDSQPLQKEKSPRKEQQQINEYLYIQTEYCEKGNLRQCIKEGLYKEEQRVWQFFREMCEGLSHIHKNNVFHRDLKPENIFLTLNSHIKIGDFGLATSERQLEEKRNVSNCGTVNYKPPMAMALPDMTKLSVAEKKFYLSSLDIYSLGLIFFEMNYPHMETEFERGKVFEKIKGSTIILPDDFHDGTLKELQVSILRKMLDQDPKHRPCANDVLELLPPPPEGEIENRKVISKILSDPQCRLYQQLMAELFEQPKNSKLQLESRDTMEGLDLKYCRKQESVKRACRQILKDHGAQMLNLPLLLPSFATIGDDDHVVRILDCTGKMMMLAPDLRVSFVKYISQKDERMLPLRRCTIDRVYRKNENHAILPKEHLECAFDIVETFSSSAITERQEVTSGIDSIKPSNNDGASTSSPVTRDELPCLFLSKDFADDSEIIHVVVKILEKYPVLAENGYACQMNHALLIQAVLLHAGVPVEKIRDAVSILTATDFNTESSMDDCGFSQMLFKVLGEDPINDSLNDLLKFEGSIEELSSTLHEIMNGQSEAGSKARNGFNELRMVTQRLKQWAPKLECRICLRLLTSARYSSGIIFQVTAAKQQTNPDKDTTVFASGYRYDDLINQLRHPKHKSSVLRGAGVSIDIDAIAKSLPTVKRVNSNFSKSENTCAINTQGREVSNSEKGSTLKVATRADGVASTTVPVDLGMQIEANAKFELQRKAFDIAMHEKNIYVASHSDGMREYTLEGKEKSFWQAPPFVTNNPPDIVYTVHTMPDGRVLVGLLKSKSVVVLRRSNTRRDDDQVTWDVDRSINLDAQPWRIASDGNNRIAVIHAPDASKVKPGTKITMALLSDGSSSVYPFGIPIAAVAVSKDQIFAASLRHGPKGQMDSEILALNENFSQRWMTKIKENVFDVACDSSGRTVYLALGYSRCVKMLNGEHGSPLVNVLPYCNESPIRLWLAEGSPNSLAVLRYDRKTVEVHTI